ncbi:MAG: hypothetical protein K6E35_06220 [Bacteroidales bacterium]|nr:hypothetical protein [Bacteroidales bacterium]
MRKIILSAALLLAASASAGAQNMYDAINISQNNYFGTARSMALGNAMTALGGDLGSIGINPAGSAVSSYGQITITPGWNISSVASSYSPVGESAFGMTSRLNNTRMNMPNVGMTFNFDTGRRYGVKRVTFGLVCNQTNNYNFVAEGFGSNSRTSKAAEFADFATGFDEDILAAEASFRSSDVPWDLLTAYQGAMISGYGWPGLYTGASEVVSPDGDYHYVPGALSQTSYLTKRGSKNDLIMNIGLNVDDRVYLGFNLGLPTARYRYSETFYETAINPDLFPVLFEDNGTETRTYFNRDIYDYQYISDVSGIYASVGVILRPFDGLRVGASFQTPTAYTISETWQYSASTVFDDRRFEQSSPKGDFAYTLRSPYRASFGAAFTFGKLGLVSVDYEMADYSVMRFRNIHETRLNQDLFRVQNMTNKYFAGVSHAVRVGAELRVTPEWSLRAGYSLSTSPERYWTNSDGDRVTADDYKADFDSYLDRAKNLVTPHYYGDRTRTFSLGVGYSSPGSFFMDFAARRTRYPSMVFAPYYDYDSYDRDGNLQFVESPRIMNLRDLWNVSATFGWRF